MTKQSCNREGPSPKRKQGRPEPPAQRDPLISILALLWKGLLIVVLFASILFAHGCHGDEDHELFSAWMKVIGK
jgi:hypothetical protein